MKHAIPFVLFAMAGFAIALAVRPEPDPKKPVSTTQAKKPPPPTPGAGLLVDLGNGTCPVMKNEVDAESFVEWNHLKVGFCRPGCDKRFLKNPEKSLDEAGIKWRDAAAAIKAYTEASDEHKAHMLMQLKKRWKVVRQ